MWWCNLEKLSKYFGIEVDTMKEKWGNTKHQKQKEILIS